MRIAIFSDIHANLEALEAVATDAGNHKVDTLWFLGDAVGYGPDPIPAVRFIKENVAGDNWVLGNHDAMVAGLLTDEEKGATGSSALEVADLHRSQLESDDEIWQFWQDSYIDERRMPCSKVIDGRQHTLTHAGQRERHILRYIYPWQKDFFLPSELQWLKAQQEKSELPQVQWMGHTHVPMLVRGIPDGDNFDIQAEWLEPCGTYKLDEKLTMINPGSVGQPRDGDRRAAYVIFDTSQEEITFRRVPYQWQDPYRKLNALKRFPNENGEDPLKLEIGTVENLMLRLVSAEPRNDTPPNWHNHFKYVARVGCNGHGHV